MKNVNHHYYRFQSIILLCVMGAYALPLIVIGLLEGFLGGALAIAGAISAIFLIPTLYYCFQWHHYATVNLTNIQRVTLREISSGFFKFVGFKVTLSIDGKERTFITKEVFNTSVFSRLSLENYLNQTVEVGYNEDREELVIIGLVSNQ